MDPAVDYTKLDRSQYWDNFKGILIVLVVLGHYLWEYWGLGYADFILKFIYLFHMPAFAFVSGFLSKSENSRSKQKILRLAMIYIIFNTLIMILHNLFFDPYHALLTPFYSYWFIISLICWRIGIKYLENIKHILLIATAASFLIGFWNDVTNVLAISRTIVFFPFFLIGYKRNQKIQAGSNSSKKAADYIKGLLLAIIASMTAYFIIGRTEILTETNIVMDAYTSVDDFITRFVVFDVSLIMIGCLVLLTGNRHLPLLSRLGRNSLPIYVLHRPFTLLFVLLFPRENYSNEFIVYSVLAAATTVTLLGLDVVAVKLNQWLDRIYIFLTEGLDGVSPTRKKLWGMTTSLLIILFLSQPIITALLPNKTGAHKSSGNSEYPIHKQITKEQEEMIRDSLSLAFVGDLILLQGQVENAYDETAREYNFNPMFEYARMYLDEADLAIGIFEGPAAGEEAGYSTSNYGDGIPLALNFPDSFIKAVKDSGIDLVSTANNHLLDQGVEGAYSTKEKLKAAGLLQTGTYRSAEEKNEILIVEVEGVRIGILSYTFKSNGYSDKYFLEENPNITSILVDPQSQYFRRVKTAVQEDFQRIKTMAAPPDFIAVIPHMGTQFTHETDSFQTAWNRIFIEAGADIILGDHAHAVQPVEYMTSKNEDGTDKTSLIVNCPGNFANSYTEFNGDATSVVEIFIDKGGKKITGAAVIPMYTQSPANGNYRALPIYSILHEKELQKEISVLEMERVSEVQKLISSVMLGVELTLDQAQARYFLFPDGYVRQPVLPLAALLPNPKSEIITSLLDSDDITFIGDSITKGSRNGGYGWFEPIAVSFPDKSIANLSWDSATSMTLLDNFEEIIQHNSDLYVIAIGTNDVRYRDKKTCAMDAASYVNNIDLLVAKIRKRNPSAEFILVAPWLALPNDPFSKLPIAERDRMLEEYADSLETYAMQKGLVYSNPNQRISEVFTIKSESDYLTDHIHPNADKGIVLYSEAFLADLP